VITASYPAASVPCQVACCCSASNLPGPSCGWLARPYATVASVLPHPCNPGRDRGRLPKEQQTESRPRPRWQPSHQKSPRPPARRRQDETRRLGGPVPACRNAMDGVPPSGRSAFSDEEATGPDARPPDLRERRVFVPTGMWSAPPLGAVMVECSQPGSRAPAAALRDGGEPPPLTPISRTRALRLRGAGPRSGRSARRGRPCRRCPDCRCGPTQPGGSTAAPGGESAVGSQRHHLDLHGWPHELVFVRTESAAAPSARCTRLPCPVVRVRSQLPVRVEREGRRRVSHPRPRARVVATAGVADPSGLLLVLCLYTAGRRTPGYSR
jgi:hypothetical protein